MADQDVPKTMKRWQYDTWKGGIEEKLTLNPTAPLPKCRSDQFLVKVVAAALNPGNKIDPFHSCGVI